MQDDKYIPLSYISQFHYCKRRVGLLMLEQQWSDSTDTIKGTAEHKNVHTAGSKSHNGHYVLTELQVFSKKMGLAGKCDVVEAIPCLEGVSLPFLDENRYTLYPIEYKHGKFRNELEYELQLCAQAMCLEEMYCVKIKSGALFYISSHRRKEILFDDELRNTVLKTASELAKLLDSEQVPQAVGSSKCSRCSLKDICMPDILYSVNEYMKKIGKDMRRDLE